MLEAEGTDWELLGSGVSAILERNNGERGATRERKSSD